MTKLPAKKENYWISLSDIMTGLMVIFLFIALSYMRQIKQDQENQNRLLEEYQDTYVALYDTLKQEFESDFSKDKWNAELAEDLSIRFLNEEVLFDNNSADIKEDFNDILDSFFPRYLGILLSDNFRDKISEVRIEGHTDSRGEYMYNVRLSQNRTSNVLDYLFYKEDSEYQNASETDRELMRYWFTTTGFSYGRTMDQSGELTLVSGQNENRQRSRRVEFRIVMKSEEVIRQVLEMING
jgi:outer membrane protein OmpA-like peptidoglycan-associated protein